jgi:hypothetical protein
MSHAVKCVVPKLPETPGGRSVSEKSDMSIKALNTVGSLRLNKDITHSSSGRQRQLHLDLGWSEYAGGQVGHFVRIQRSIPQLRYRGKYGRCYRQIQNTDWLNICLVSQRTRTSLL